MGQSNMHSLPVILLLPLLLQGVTPAPTQEEWPGQWYYLETMLQGSKVLTLMPDRQVRMHSKHHDQHQEWRLKTDGCLVNKASLNYVSHWREILRDHSCLCTRQMDWRVKSGNGRLTTWSPTSAVTCSTTISCWTSYGKMYPCIHQEPVSMSGIMITRILRGGRWSLSSN